MARVNNNKIFPNDIERLKRLCKHEASHLVLSKLFGFETAGISMSISQISGHYGEAIVILPKERIDNYDKLKIYTSVPLKIGTLLKVK